MNQDRRKFVPGIRLAVNAVFLDGILFEISSLPDDYFMLGNTPGIALTRRQDNLEGEEDCEDRSPLCRDAS